MVNLSIALSRRNPTMHNSRITVKIQADKTVASIHQITMKTLERLTRASNPKGRRIYSLGSHYKRNVRLTKSIDLNKVSSLKVASVSSNLVIRRTAPKDHTNQYRGICHTCRPSTYQSHQWYDRVLIKFALDLDRTKGQEPGSQNYGQGKNKLSFPT